MPKGSSKTGGPARRYLGAEWRFTRHLLEMGDLANNPATPTRSGARQKGLHRGPLRLLLARGDSRRQRRRWG